MAGKRNIAVLVVGCHRSGTSLLARGINAAGMTLADSLIPPAPDNPTGFWEDADVVALNRKILAAAGNTWDSVYPDSQDLLTGAEQWVDAAYSLLEANYRGAVSFAIKDPALCLTLPIWCAALARMNVDVRLAVVHRSPLAVADSLRKRNGLSREKSLLLWLSYNWSMLSFIACSALPFAVTDYDKLLVEPTAELGRVMEQLGLPVEAESLAGFASDFVDRQLRHSTLGADKLSGAPTARLAGQLAAILSQLEQVASPDAARALLADLLQTDLGERIARRSQAFVPQDRAAMLVALREQADEREEALRQALGWQDAAAALESELLSARKASQEEIDRLTAELQQNIGRYESQVKALQQELAGEQEAAEREIQRLSEASQAVSHDYEAQLSKLEDEARASAQGYEAQLAALASEKSAADQAYQAQLEKLRGESRASVEGYEAQLKTLGTEKTEAAKDYEAQLSQLESEKRASAEEYEAQLSALTAEGKASAEGYEAQLEALTAEGKASSEQYEAQLKALAAEKLTAAEGYEQQLATLAAEGRAAAEAYEAQLAVLEGEKADAAGTYESEITRLQSDLETLDAERQAAATQFAAELADREQQLQQASRGIAELQAMMQVELDRVHGQMEDVAAAYERQIQAEQSELARVHQGYGDELVRLNRELGTLYGSRSFRLGRLLTWPLRWPRDGLRRLLGRSDTGRLALATLKHPGRALRLASPRRVFNFLDILLRRRKDLRQTFSHYNERLRQTHVSVHMPPEYAGSCEGLSFPEHPAPRVSVIIPVYNQLDYTLGCLHSIRAQWPACSLEIIVADDCSSDDTEQVVSAIPGVRYRRNEQNLQFLLSVNAAAKTARGEFIFLLNNDTRVTEGWLDSLVEVMDADPTVGVAGSRLLYPDGRLQEAGGIVWRDASAWNFGRLDDPEKPEYRYLKESDYISGAALMVRTSLFHELGYFDERYVPAYYEDTDLCFAVRDKGFKVMLQPRSNVVHYEGISHGTDTSVGVKRHQVENQQNFVEKWRDTLERDHFPNAEQVFLARDRSRYRQTVLVVDHYVPHFDRDAGSRSTWQYLKLLVAEGFNVKFIGDNFFRHEPYTTHMEALGIEVLCGNDYYHGWREWLLEHAAYIDVMYLHRPHITEKYLDTIAEMNPAPKTIYFGHDLHYLRLERQAVLEDSQQLRAEAADWHDKEYRIFEAMDLVYYPSQVEVDTIHRERPELPVKAIPLYVFDSPPKRDYRPEKRSGILFIGGFNHPPNADAILWFMTVFAELEAVLPDLVLHIVGSNMPDTITALASERVRVHGFLPDEDVDALYAQVRLSVVPLRFGAGIKGKVLESIHKGVPVLTTPIGAEGVMEADRAMCIAAEDSFGQALTDLYPDFERLARFSTAGGEVISEHYSEAAARRVVLQDFRRD